MEQISAVSLLPEPGAVTSAPSKSYAPAPTGVPAAWFRPRATPPPPYLYEGDDGHYDEGRNRFRAANMPPLPEPAGEPVCIELAAGTVDALTTATGVRPVALTKPQWMWFANLPYDTLGEHAPALYDALASAGLRAFVPYDNLARAQRERQPA